MAGTCSSHIFSYIGYQYRSVSGGEFQWPPDGSGFKLHPMKPSSFTQRSSSATELSSDVPGDCGSWHTPTKFVGYRFVTRWIKSLQTCDQCRLVTGVPTC